MAIFNLNDIKRWSVAFALLIALIFMNTSARAQQAKAYETVHYRAKAGDLLFQLNYADGYIGASQIKLRENGRKTRIFLPESGAIESNGDFRFVPQQIAHNGDICLTRLNEEETAPDLIRGSYRAKGRTVVLIFKRSKS
jgi:hypothetical protein